jgi:hypothetical protein
MMADWGGSAAGTALSRPSEHSIASQQVLRLQGGRSEAGVCTSEARKIRVTLARTSGRLGFLVGRGTHEATSVAVANGAAVARRSETVYEAACRMLWRSSTERQIWSPSVAVDPLSEQRVFRPGNAAEPARHSSPKGAGRLIRVGCFWKPKRT